MGKAPDGVFCVNHQTQCNRHYESVSFNTNDEFRKSYLSSKTHTALGEQGRPMDPFAPKDKYDVKKIQEATGRRYFGEDVSNVRLTPELKKQYGVKD